MGYTSNDRADRIIRGLIASLACTTKAEVYEGNISPCFVVAVDESREQSQKVVVYQNWRSAGKVDKDGEKRVRVFLQNCLRLLDPLEVINPYAARVELPAEAHKIRRLNELYQCFVRQVTLLNQFRRQRDKLRRVQVFAGHKWVSTTEGLPGKSSGGVAGGGGALSSAQQRITKTSVTFMILAPIPIAMSSIDMRVESHQILDQIDERFLAAVHALLKTYERQVDTKEDDPLPAHRATSLNNSSTRNNTSTTPSRNEPG